MPGDLQTPGYDQLVRRVGGIIGPGSKVSEALAELFPVLELENTTPELLALRGWRTAWQSTERPAVAGQLSKSQLFNPAGSGHIVAVTQVYVNTNSDNQAIQMEVDALALTAAATAGLFRDSRFGVPRSTVAVTRSVDNVATGGGPRLFTQRPGFFLRDDNGLAVLTPGSGLSIGTVVANQILTITYFWRERLALESELSFP